MTQQELIDAALPYFDSPPKAKRRQWMLERVGEMVEALRNVGEMDADDDIRPRIRDGAVELLLTRTVKVQVPVAFPAPDEDEA